MSFERVGSSQPITVDVRILAATHQDLEALIRAGRFREDLYYRLNVICLYAPALRERREDIFELALYFLNLHAQRTGKLVTHLDPEAVDALVAYDWPGNIRELENVLERAVVLADGPASRSMTCRWNCGSRAGDGCGRDSRAWLQPSCRPLLPPVLVCCRAKASVTSQHSPAASAWYPSDAEPTPGEEWNVEFIAYERQRLIDALNEANGNKSVAARLLGMPRSTFFSKVKKHGIV